MSERTPLLKDLLIFLLYSFCPGVSDYPGSFFFDALPGTVGNVVLQAFNWMLFMTFGIVLPGYCILWEH